ncbi:MAG: hypothetical protein ACOYWZ_20160 [Bacillota bacterium]
MNIELTQPDIKTISEIIARNGYLEWTLIGFTPAMDYGVFSYMTCPKMIPLFRKILVAMVEAIDRNYYKEHLDA